LTTKPKQECAVFRSDNQAETYLYLAREVKFEDLPTDLQRQFGAPAFVMNLELTPDFKLSRVDTQSVMSSLEKEGYYLQLPPRLPVEEEIARRFS
jgi:uncharacterized protein YcgL (UPF0745 family)